MYLTPILVPASICLLLTLYFESRQKVNGIVIFKTATSLFFILAAVMQPHPDVTYFFLLIAGLVFCLFGDFFLALPKALMFKLGLVSFLVGHIFYIFAFFSIARPDPYTIPAAAIIIFVSTLVYRWLRPHLGDMKVPVIVYVIVISVMLVLACSVFLTYSITIEGRTLILTGALLFYLSDLFVARDRFIKDQMVNRYIGLPLYYAGQFILAYSPGFV